MKVIPETRCTH